eukprot:335621-Prymnesium_polylepis.1
MRERFNDLTPREPSIYSGSMGRIGCGLLVSELRYTDRKCPWTEPGSHVCAQSSRVIGRVA